MPVHLTDDERRITTSDLMVGFAGSRFDLKAGRAWTVITGQGKEYEVTFFEGPDGLRYGRCTCTAGKYLKRCRHLVKASRVDSILTGYGMLEERMKMAA